MTDELLPPVTLFAALSCGLMAGDGTTSERPLPSRQRPRSRSPSDPGAKALRIDEAGDQPDLRAVALFAGCLHPGDTLPALGLPAAESTPGTDLEDLVSQSNRSVLGTPGCSGGREGGEPSLSALPGNVEATAVQLERAFEPGAVTLGTAGVKREWARCDIRLAAVRLAAVGLARGAQGQDSDAQKTDALRDHRQATPPALKCNRLTCRCHSCTAPARLLRKKRFS